MLKAPPPLQGASEETQLSRATMKKEKMTMAMMMKRKKTKENLFDHFRNQNSPATHPIIAK